MQSALVVAVWAVVGLGAGLAAFPLVNLLLARYGELSPLPAPPKPLPATPWAWWCGIGSALLFAGAALGHRGDPLSLVVASCYLVALGVIFLVDFRAHLILDVVTLPALLVALLFTILQSLVDPGHHWQRSLAGAVVGLVVFGLLYGLGWLITRQEAMGMGDVKLATLTGMMVDVYHVLPAFLLAIIGGGVISALVLLVRRRGAGSYIPYGVFIAAGTAFFVLVPEGIPGL